MGNGTLEIIKKQTAPSCKMSRMYTQSNKKFYLKTKQQQQKTKHK